MAEGVRIRHKVRRNQLLPVPLLHKPFPVDDLVNRPVCGVCERLFGTVETHPCKTLHLRLDAEGAVIVSAEIWADLQRTVNSGGFTLANQVLAPPSQVVNPPTVNQHIDGIELGSGLTGLKRSQVFTSLGTVRPDYDPATRTVSFDEYLDVAGGLGVSEETAINTLLATLLGLTKKENSA